MHGCIFSCMLSCNKTYYVYINNYFSSIPLFKYLCKNNIGACSTVCTNSARFSRELKVSKELSLDWNTLLAKVVDDVLTVLWINNGLVTMLSTIYEISGDNSKVTCNW